MGRFSKASVGFDTRPHTYLTPYGQGYAAFDPKDARYKDGFETLASANDYAINRRLDCHRCGLRNGH
jgi:hypothetical protein